MQDLEVVAVIASVYILQEGRLTNLDKAFLPFLLFPG